MMCAVLIRCELVFRKFPKLDVAGSIPVSRSSPSTGYFNEIPADAVTSVTGTVETPALVRPRAL